MKLQISDISDLKEKIKPWVKTLDGNEIILLEGQLGAGKTTFVHALVQTRWDLQNDSVASPTYALHHQYTQPNSKKPEIIDHWDLFRVEQLDELDAAGFWDLLNSTHGLCVVEWPQKIDPSHWPAQRKLIKIKIEVRLGTKRELEIS